MKRLKNFFLKNRQILTNIFSFIIIAVAVLNLYYILIVTPFSNDECLWVQKGNEISIIKVKEYGVSWNAGIRDNDRLVAIDGNKIENTNQAQQILNKHTAGDYAKYTVERDGKIFYTTVFIKKLIIFGNLGFALLGFIWFIVGYIVINAKPTGRIQKIFFSVGFLFVLFLSIILIPNEGQDQSVQKRIFVLFIDIIWSLSANYLAFTIIYLFANFPKPFKFVEKKWIKRFFLYGPLVIFLISYIYRWFFVFIPNKPEHYQFIVGANNFLITSGLVIGLISLFINYWRLKTKQERKPIFVILVAYSLGVAALIYTSTIANIIADTFFNTPEYFMPIVLVAVIPISFGYSIFKYQLMDVSIVIKNAIVYGTATITVAVLYFAIVYGLGQGIGLAIGTENRSAIAAVAFVVFALIFQSTKNKFQDLLTKKFYPEQFNYQKMLLKFSKDVVSIVGFENILDSMNDTFVSSLGVKRFAILLKDSKFPLFNMKRFHGIDSPFNISDKSNKLPVYINEKLNIGVNLAIDAQQFKEVIPDECDILEAHGIFTIIPIVIKSNIIGLLLFGLKRSGSEFAGKDLDLLSAAANQAGVAIENARLYESEAKRLTIERDLENARKIQESLLPAKIPVIEGLEISGEMIPAMQVGGDYYDVIKISPSQIFIIVGDVSGKGLSASLYMSKLQTMVRLYCTQSRTPKEILVDINKKIYESIERNWFITVSSALIDTEKMNMKFCRAGHSPLLISCNGSTKIIQSKGIGLGLEEGKIFEETLEQIDMSYSKGEVFAFFSDGVSEAMNEKSDLFGIDRIAKIIEDNKTKSSNEMMNIIKSSLHEFRNGREPNDDMTMVIVKAQ